MTDHDAVMRFCKAQAQINSVIEADAGANKTLTERVRTYRSLLEDELKSNQLTCCEMIPDGASDPVYIRIKHASQPPPMDSKLLLGIISTINAETMQEKANRYGYDLPKILSGIVNDEIRTNYTKKSKKSTLSISRSKERGFIPSSYESPVEVRRLANQFIKAQTELRNMHAETKKRKEPHVAEQEIVKEEVKESLRATDPVNKMQRIHMTTSGSEWVYFLRCKESVSTKKVGVRKMIPLLETTIAKSLSSMGIGREFTESFKITHDFIETLKSHLEDDIQSAQVSKDTTRLTLERGAPRQPT